MFKAIVYFIIIVIHYCIQNQKKMKFKPRRKLNHNMFVRGKSNRAFYFPYI